jgi:hypothetical protein
VGKPEKVDYEYERNGVADVFMIFEPLAGKRGTIVTETRTAIDFADVLKYALDVMYPRTEKIVLVTDNLNTHSTASLYKDFPPEEVHRLADRFEWHYTPKHASWLDAEISSSAPSTLWARRLLSMITISPSSFLFCQIIYCRLFTIIIRHISFTLFPFLWDSTVFFLTSIFNIPYTHRFIILFPSLLWKCYSLSPWGAIVRPLFQPSQSLAGL